MTEDRHSLPAYDSRFASHGASYNPPMRITLAAALLLATALAAQDDEKVDEKAASSCLTGAALPEGARRLLEKNAVERTSAIVKAVYADVRFDAIETLSWEGDRSGDKGAALRRTLAQSLAKAGFSYTDAAPAQKIEGLERSDVLLCAALRGDRRTTGIWICSAEGAVLIWGVGPAEAAFENVLYTAPPGWRTATAADGVTLTPGDLLPEESLSVFILPGRDFKGDLAASADELFAETAKALGVEGTLLARDRSEVRTTGKGWDFFHGPTTVKKGDARLYMDAWFIKVGGRLERVVVLSNFVNHPYDNIPLHNPKVHDAFHRFLFGLRFKNHKEPAMPEARLTQDGIGGVWIGVGLSFDGLAGELQYKGITAAFYTNGLVFFSAKLQTFLFEGMDPYLAREITPSSWGTYTFENGRGTIKMRSGDIPIRLDGDKLVVTRMKTDHKYERLAPVDGTRWDGMWAFAVPEGKAPSIAFTKDGRFADDGAIKVLEHSLYPLHSTGDKPGAGTYEVKNYTVVFRYDDGRTFTSAFVGLGYKKGELRPESLVLGFNHDTLKKK